MVYLSQRPQVMKFDPAPKIFIVTPLIRQIVFLPIGDCINRVLLCINSTKIYTKTCNAHIDSEWISVCTGVNTTFLSKNK